MKRRHFSYACAVILGISVGACSQTAPEPSSNAESAPVSATQAGTEGAATLTPSAKPNAPGALPAQKAAFKKPTPPSTKAKTPEVPFEGRRIALVHTANVVGELEPCG